MCNGQRHAGILIPKSESFWREVELIFRPGGAEDTESNNPCEEATGTLKSVDDKPTGAKAQDCGD